MSTSSYLSQSDKPDEHSSSRDEIKRFVRELDTLPSSPSVAAKLLDVLVDEAPDLQDVVKLFELDQAASTRLLRYANSPYFASRNPVVSIPQAVALLGVSRIRCVLLGVAISVTLISELRQKCSNDLTTLWKHALACAVCAQVLAERILPELRSEAFAMGLLHDVGKLVLKEFAPAKYKEAEAVHVGRGAPLVEVEREVLGVDHPTVGKWLAERWNLPLILIQGIWLHHHSLDVIGRMDFHNDESRKLILILGLANKLAGEVMNDSEKPRQASVAEKDILTLLGLSPEDLDGIMASSRKYYTDHMELVGFQEDELSSYIVALQRANHKLASLGSAEARLEDQEQVIHDLRRLHDFHAELSRLDDSEDVLERVAMELAKGPGKKSGVIYLLRRKSRKLIGMYWSTGEPLKRFSLDLDQDYFPVRTNIPFLEDRMNQLIQTGHTRFLKVSSGNQQGILFQYYQPHLLIPLLVEGGFGGEILINDGRGEYQGEASRGGYRYLAATAAQALSRIRALERVRESAEMLNVALSRIEGNVKISEEPQPAFQQLFEHSNEATVLHDLEGKILLVNDRATELLGYGIGEMIGRSLFEFLPEAQRAMCRSSLNGQWGVGSGVRLVTELQRKDGKLLAAEISSRIFDEGSDSVQTLIRETSGRSEAGKELSLEKERFEATLRSITDGVIATDTAGNIVFCNRAAELLTGWPESEVMGKPLDAVFVLINTKVNSLFADPLKMILERSKSQEYPEEVAIVSKEGKGRLVALGAAPIYDLNHKVLGMITVFRDLSKERRAAEELFEARRFESLRTLASGISHDFNNILTVIMGNISLARMSLQSGKENPLERLGVAEKACLMAKDLTQQLSVFSKGGASAKKARNITEVVKGAVSMGLRGSQTQCNMVVSEGLWKVDCDSNQLHQVISNIITNAREAMANGGTVEVKAENVQLAANEMPHLRGGRYVKISIRDQGVGIPRENTSKIFDPYFSTKEKGHGGAMGLGLTIAYSIIRGHEGHILVESEEGKGSAFHIYLPSSEEPAEIGKELEKEAIAGKRRVLVVENEEMAGKMLKGMLREIGYEAEVAKHGAEAVELYRRAKEAGTPFDVSIVDLEVREGIGARDVVREILRIDPSARTIVSSASPGFSLSQPGVREHGFSAAVNKPYTVTQLIEVMHEVLTESERREHPRVKLQWPVIAQAGERSIEDGEIEDISLNGAFIRLPNPLEPGENLRMIIKPLDTRFLSVSSEVIWSRIYGEGKMSPHWEMGVRFLSITDQDRQLLHKLISN